MARHSKLMLVKAVAGLGELGDIVKVRPGYARNYLVPRGIAAAVSKNSHKQVAAEKKRAALEVKKVVDSAKATQELLRSISLHIEAKSGEGGHLYGSVSAAMIAEALEKQGVKIDPASVNLENPIKELGIYTVTLKLHADVTGLVKVYVVAPPPEKGEAKKPEKADAKKAEPKKQELKLPEKPAETKKPGKGGSKK